MTKLTSELKKWLFEDQQSVPIKGVDGQRAVMIRVYYRGGWFTEHPVDEEPTHDQ